MLAQRRHLRGAQRGGQAGWGSSEVDIEGLQDAPAAQRAVAVIDGVAHQYLGAGLAQAQVPAGQEQHRLALVLADDALLPLLLLLQQLPGVLAGCRLLLVEPLPAPGRCRSETPGFLFGLQSEPCFRGRILCPGPG